MHETCNIVQDIRINFRCEGKFVFSEVWLHNSPGIRRLYCCDTDSADKNQTTTMINKKACQFNHTPSEDDLRMFVYGIIGNEIQDILPFSTSN